MNKPTPMRTFILLLILNGFTIARAESISVDIQNSLVSVEAVDASLIAVATRLSELSGIPVSFTEGVDRQINISIFEEPLKSAVAKLSENNLITTKKVNGEEVITEITIMLQEEQSDYSDGNLPTGEPAADDVYIEPPAESDTPMIIEETNNVGEVSSDTEQAEPAVISQ
ncbi:MAG: hypothetical protein ACI8UP_004045 [Porticoccaceae bacterium]